MSGDGTTNTPGDDASPLTQPPTGPLSPDPSAVPQAPEPDLTAAPEPDLAAAVAHEPRQLKRSWAQRLVLGLNVVVIVACFSAAAGIWYASEKANDSRVVTLVTPEQAASPTTPGDITLDSTPDETDDTRPEVTIPPLEDPSAKNFLITGTDNGACVDPDSPYAGAFGERFGDRSDTVMIIRVDPTTARAAILSFPRDLWVEIAGTGRSSRINSAFSKDDPTTLIFTIYENFGIIVDHYINIDFCAFKGIVDAVGGVKVPFEYAVKDENTGLNVPEPMCYKFDGDSGLAYVRSRHFDYLDPATGQYREDPSSDLGRISRQQDFMQRLIQRALDKGATNPRTAKRIIDSALQYVTRDDALTVGKMLQFAQAMRSIQPGTIQTYQIETYPMVISGQAVLDPRIEGDNMQAVLAVFRGQAELATAPEQVFESTTTTSPVVVTTAPPVTTTPSSVPGGTTVPGTTTTTVTTKTTLPASTATEVVKGIVPPDDPSCR
jgi:LCP family protein required for cell wall assembly